ncbi:M20/M25/M40 family metallo-hydrolase [Granulicella sibirica]|uniref:Peptidase M20:Peptidase M20 n=1 Tax=Granulicella sibirica TaxID=2479048 RepID=A0A4Q0SWN0_9BACT|nr:M20/M25/M40 family metallo-hydrolase [Granulicella sibirica]RXH54360.1 Peptidase M20:Peptidase M20 [Granulicella sibirica]
MRIRGWSGRLALMAVCGCGAVTAWGQAPPALLPEEVKVESRGIFKELIEINTTNSVGNVTMAAEAMKARFLRAGFAEEDLPIVGANPKKMNLVVRLRGTGAKKPILVLCHLDVVEAERKDWTTDPFQFVEKDGFFYGRGTQDMKEADAILVETLIRFKREGYKPDRDIILVLTAGEEGGGDNGVRWLVENRKDLIDADFALNPDSGPVLMKNGKATIVTVEAIEKSSANFEVTATNRGGHSSLPRPDNAIYALAAALGKVEHAPFPAELNTVTRPFFEKVAATEPADVAADMRALLSTPMDAGAVERLSRDPFFNATLHTTCVATRLSGGHANNALPQTATAVVNCRILPGHSADEVGKVLADAVGDPSVTVKQQVLAGAGVRKPMAAPPMREDVFGPLDKLSALFWPEAVVVPQMEPGGSDSTATAAAGIPSYGISGVELDEDDNRMHGKDERLGVEAYFHGVAFYYAYLKALSGGS